MLIKEDENEANDGERMDAIATKFFQNLFASKGTSNATHILSRIQISIIFEEVFVALNNMGPLKALNVDGFPTIFFPTILENYW